MTAIKGAWSADELALFLQEALMPLRLGCHHPDGGLWMLSLWYRWEDDAFLCATGRDSDVARFLRKDDDVAFEVSTNAPPYMGVRGKGTATLSPDPEKTVLRNLLERYLGGTDSELAEMLLRDDREELVITIAPTRLFTWDFTPRMQTTLETSPSARQPEPESPKHR